MEQTEEVQGQDVNQAEHFDDESNPVLDNIEQILGNNTPEPEIEETIAEVPPDEPEVVEVVIDDAMILEHPTLVGLKGKPMSELAKSYDNLSREFTKLTQKPTNETKTKIKTEPEATEEIPYVDSYDDPAGHEAWLKSQLGKNKVSKEDIDKLVEERLNDEKAKIQAEKDIQTEMDTKAAQFQKDVNDGLTKVLNGVDPDEAIKHYFNSNADTLLTKDGVLKEEIEEIYAKNPDYFIKTVADHVALVQNTSNTQADVRKKAFDITKNGLQKNVIGELTQTTVNRANFEVDENQQLVDKIYEITVAPPD